VLKDNNQIVINIQNRIQEELIKNNKPLIVSWLRKEFQNNSIDLKTELISEPEIRIIYTDAEKLEEMLRKNKHLALLKERFHLDFDN
jgi:DNA polymerase III subunit gamma/tau